MMVQQQLKEPFVRVDAVKGNELYESKSTVWIDVREPGEWNEGHIPGSTLVPLNTLLLSPRKYLNGDNVVFYCAQGIRSQWRSSGSSSMPGRSAGNPQTRA